DRCPCLLTLAASLGYATRGRGLRKDEVVTRGQDEPAHCLRFESYLTVHHVDGAERGHGRETYLPPVEDGRGDGGRLVTQRGRDELCPRYALRQDRDVLHYRHP